MLERVHRIAAFSCSEVYIATDDDRIKESAESFGAKVVLTSPDCSNGTERVKEASEALGLNSHIIVNLQGDAVLTPPWVISSLIDSFGSDEAVQVATPARRISKEETAVIAARRAQGITTGTFVVTDKNSNALYFSKQPIPFTRDKSDFDDFKLHIGMYAYTSQALKAFCELPMGKLERAEKLEQLRALENGIPIKVVEVDYKGRTHHSVDQPEDVEVVEGIIAEEGELV